jgi:hypothetical protein
VRWLSLRRRRLILPLLWRHPVLTQRWLQLRRLVLPLWRLPSTASVCNVKSELIHHTKYCKSMQENLDMPSCELNAEGNSEL